MKRLNLKFKGHQILVRDFAKSDIPAILKYWQGQTEQDLERMGLNPAALMDSKVRAEMYHRILSLSPENCSEWILVAEVNNIVIGYTTLKHIERGNKAYGHCHMICPEFTHIGFGSFLFPEISKVFFKMFDLKKIIIQTSVSNPGVNKMVQKYIRPAKMRNGFDSSFTLAVDTFEYELTKFRLVLMRLLSFKFLT